MIDTMSYLVGSQAFSSQNYLASSTPGGNPTICLWDQQNGIWYQMKSLQGWPWDIQVVTPGGIFQLVTENGWTSPSNFKTFNSPSFRSVGSRGGIAWAPRQIDGGGLNLPIITSDSTYDTYVNCAKTATQNLGGEINTTLIGPIDIALGGDLGVQSCLVVEYEWGSTLQNLERHYYALGYGHVWWELYTLQNGVYTRTQQNLTNKIMAYPGAQPVPVFPCGLPA